MVVQGRLDARSAASLYTLTECCALLAASIVLLSMLGVNISALLLPAGVCLAIASKDLLQNMLAGVGQGCVNASNLNLSVAVRWTDGHVPCLWFAYSKVPPRSMPRGLVTMMHLNSSQNKWAWPQWLTMERLQQSLLQGKFEGICIKSHEN